MKSLILYHSRADIKGRAFPTSHLLSSVQATLMSVPSVLSP